MEGRIVTNVRKCLFAKLLLSFARCMVCLPISTATH